MTFRNQFPYHQVFLEEPLLPILQVFQRLRTEILEIIQRPLKVLREHFLIEALEGQSSRCVTSGKVLVWSALKQSPPVNHLGPVHAYGVHLPPREEERQTYRSIKAPARGYVKHTTAHSKIDRLVILAVELDECRWGVGAENRGRWTLGQGYGGLGAQLNV